MSVERRRPKKYILTIILGILVIILGYTSYRKYSLAGGIDYNEHLKNTAVTVNDTKLTFEDLAFYVVYEEQKVEQDALVYNPSNTNKYWNLHVDGQFIRITARDSAMQMAIHDEIFYQMAVKENTELTEDEINYAKNTQADFESDMEDFGQTDKLNVKQSVYNDTIMKIALAQKYQEIYAQMNGVSVDAYNFDGDSYKKLLKKNSYKINERLWKNVRFGKVSLH